jgi:hypothetical protein
MDSEIGIVEANKCCMLEWLHWFVFVAILNVSQCVQQGPVGPMTFLNGQQHPLGTRYLHEKFQQLNSGSVQRTYVPYLQGLSVKGVTVIHPPRNCNDRRDTIFPERPGQPKCERYMKTGDCKFGITCRYHHPKDRAIPSPSCVLNPSGLPLRPGAPPCSFYTHFGICKFGPTCKFDHPLVVLTSSPSTSSLASSSNEPASPSEEHPDVQQLRDGSDPSTTGVSVGATTSQVLSTQATTPEMGSRKDSQLKVMNREGATWCPLDDWNVLNIPLVAKERVAFQKEQVSVDNEPQGSHNDRKGYV